MAAPDPEPSSPSAQLTESPPELFASLSMYLKAMLLSDYSVPLNEAESSLLLSMVCTPAYEPAIHHQEDTSTLHNQLVSATDRLFNRYLGESATFQHSYSTSGRAERLKVALEVVTDWVYRAVGITAQLLARRVYSAAQRVFQGQCDSEDLSRHYVLFAVASMLFQRVLAPSEVPFPPPTWCGCPDADLDDNEHRFLLEFKRFLVGEDYISDADDPDAAADRDVDNS
ncbi:hypothetical protein AC578_4119 [Pseudocercospora eumusae]|uniref:Uncharacterized protein n=1 Tax=Pseudocercospora eumusae TaxID=321146 RepID=A0A139HF39_9PEZI|nr:hypothetical protein AC578_4119 [Pseudocercospora eumusae]